MSDSGPGLRSLHQVETLDLSKFDFVRVLDESPTTKMITIEARYKEDYQPAVIRLERTPLAATTFHELIGDKQSKVSQEFANDIYGSYNIVPSLDVLNSLKGTIIHPANDQVITKYTKHERSYIYETVDVYEHLVKPYVKKKLGPCQESINWVLNILNHKSEVERIVYEDEDTTNGFIMIPDLKTTSNDANSLYLLAICHAKGIKSLRDLTADHLPLLRNILHNGFKAIKEKYYIDRAKLRVFVHYQPSFYHFHVHFKNINSVEPSTISDRDVLLTDVINNLSMMSDFYQRATLTYPLSHLDPLYDIIKNNKDLAK